MDVRTSLLHVSLGLLALNCTADPGAATAGESAESEAAPIKTQPVHPSFEWNTAILPAWLKPFSATLNQELVVTGPPEPHQFGYAVAVEDDTAVIGAPHEATAQNGPGSVFVFGRSGGTWTQTQVLLPNNSAVGDGFGSAVALKGDTLVVGAFPRDTFTGAAYVFTRSGTTWSQQQQLIPKDAAQFDDFGFAVAIHDHRVIVGAPQTPAAASVIPAAPGKAYIFVLSGGIWVQEQELMAKGAMNFDTFGCSVSLDDRTALIGAPGRSHDRGAVDDFVRAGGTWFQRQELTAANGAPGDQFGTCTSLGFDDDTALIGAAGRKSTQGAAYVFQRFGPQWFPFQELTASVAVPGGEFGFSVALQGRAAVVGAPGNISLVGSAYLFERAFGHWFQVQQLAPKSGAPSDQFGFSVALDDRTILVGAPGTSAADGATYVFGF